MTSTSTKHFDISQLPSVKDGMSQQDESLKRIKTVRFIEETCRLLKLPRVAVATATVFFHRFYAKHSFQTHDRFEVAVAAIVLAAKTEESPKKLNVVIEEASRLKLRNMQAGRLSQQPVVAAGSASDNNNTSSPSASFPASSVVEGATAALDPKSEEFAKLKERVLLLERVILHTIGFELSVTHPYKFIVEITKKAVQKKQIEMAVVSSPPDTTSSSLSTTQTQTLLMNKIVQIAMNFANDSLQTSLCLQASPDKIAVACVFLACQFAQAQPAQDKTWIEVLSINDVEMLVTVCLQILDLVMDRRGVDEAVLVKVRASLDKLKKERATVGIDARPVGKEESAGEPTSKKPRID